MTFNELITKIEHQGKTLVWWSPDQIARGEDVLGDPKKGERAWSVPRKTGEFLYNFVLREKPRIVLELGTSIGYSTAWMAHAAADYGGHIHSIEMRPQKYQIANKNLRDGNLHEIVTLYNAPIIDVIKNLDMHLNGSKIDLVFMDADRGHYHEYFPIITKHLSDDATIIADNAVNMQDRMKPFLDALEKNNWKFEILDFDNGILIARRQRSGGTL